MGSRTVEPLLLLLDTCGSQGSVALTSGDRLLAEVALPERMASAAVLPAVREVLQAAGVSLADVAGYGVVSGPGSFTGVRVGLAVAKGLAEATNLPLAAVSRLAVLTDVSGLREGFVALHAGPGQVYVGTVHENVCAAERLMSTTDFLLIAEQSPVVLAESALQQTLEAASVATKLVIPTARDSRKLVQASLQRGGSDLGHVDANYVRDEASIYARQRSR